MEKPYYIASVSWGKDSLAMLIMLIENYEPLDEVVFYDTGMEFRAIYAIRDKMLPTLKQHGIKYTELTPSNPFIYQMFDRPVNGKNGQHFGYSWCGGKCRWMTAEKLRKLNRYAEERNAIVYVGLAADEKKRLEKEHEPYKRYPLAGWGITEDDALSICYARGYCWLENGIRLYEILDRVSCWCCANKNLKELRNIRIYLPDYWDQLKALQSRTDRPMKGRGKACLTSIKDLRRKAMGTITIKNLSTLTDDGAVLRVSDYIIDGFNAAECPYAGAHRVNITKRGDTYTVTDAEEVE